MKKLGILMLGLIGLSINGFASTEALFKLGNQAYQKGAYEQAIEYYDSIRGLGKESTALYYNLGNAHYQLGALAKAILNYERALRLSPDDEEVLHNLSLAENKRVDRFESMPPNLFKAFRLSVLQVFSPDNWARIGIAFLALALIGLALYLFTALGRVGFIGLIFGGILSVFSFTMALSYQHYQKEHPELIIMSDSAYVKSGPGSDAEDLFILHAGTKALQIEQFEAWTKLRLSDGKIGWLPNEKVEQIP